MGREGCQDRLGSGRRSQRAWVSCDKLLLYPDNNGEPPARRRHGRQKKAGWGVDQSTYIQSPDGSPDNRGVESKG